MNSIEVQSDKIILHWDGRLPAGTPANAVFHDGDIVQYWQHLKGFANHSKRFGGFVLGFSRQNLQRLERQFGTFTIRSGKDRIAEITEQEKRFREMERIAMKVKTLPVERLPKFDSKMPPLGPHQNRGVTLLCNIRNAPLWLDCGSGKTFCVLVSTEKKIKLGVVPRGKTLICTKLSTIENVWLSDARKFTDLHLINLWIPPGPKRREKFLEKLNTPADVYVINHDGVRTFQEELVAQHFLKVVVDESSILKGFHGMDERIKGGQFGRALMEISAHAPHRVAMSGTPAPNSMLDLWGQYAFLDPHGFLLEPRFNDMRNRFMEMLDLRPKNKRYRTVETVNEKKEIVKVSQLIPLTPRMPHKWIPRRGAIEEINAIINPLAYRLKLRDILPDLPPLTIQKRRLDMDTEQARHYKEMDERLRVEIDGTRITVPMRLNKIGKLRQITAGFILDAQGEEHELDVNPKMNELDSLLNDEIGDEKVVIFGQFQYEIRSIETRYKDRGAVSVYGGNTSATNIANIEKFCRDPGRKVIVLHPVSGAHGISLVNSHYIVFFSVDYSAECNYQALRRVERPGQKYPIFAYYFLMRNTIDDIIYQSIYTKNENQAALIDGMASEEKIQNRILELWKGKP